MYDLARGLHILAVIAWMAGLLYLPRLFVYHTKHKDEPNMVATFRVMEGNLMRMIMTPAMIAAWVFGAWLIYINVSQRYGLKFFWEPWFVVKEIGIIALTGWHMYLARAVKIFASGEPPKSEKFWRMTNEIPMLLAIFMVLAVTTEFLRI